MLSFYFPFEHVVCVWCVCVCVCVCVCARVHIEQCLVYSEVKENMYQVG